MSLSINELNYIHGGGDIILPNEFSGRSDLDQSNTNLDNDTEINISELLDEFELAENLYTYLVI